MKKCMNIARVSALTITLDDDRKNAEKIEIIHINKENLIFYNAGILLYIHKNIICI